MNDALAEFVHDRGEAQAGAALAAIAADPAAAARLSELLAIDEALSARWSPARGGFADGVLAAARRGRARGRAGWVAALAAAALVAVAIVAHADHPRAPAPAIVASGALRDGAPLALDARLRAGDEIAAPPIGDATVSWTGDGTELRLDAGSRLTLDGVGPGARRVTLREGALVARVAKIHAGDSFVIATPHAEARIVGTRLRVRVDADATEVAVDEGAVDVVDRAAGTITRVVAGSSARVVGRLASTQAVDAGDDARAWLTGPAMAASDARDDAGAPCVRFAWDFAGGDGAWPAWALRPLAPAQDWRGWTGVRVRLHGRGDGRRYAIEVLDDLDTGDGADPCRRALRFSREVVDDAAGWREIELPFASLARHPTQPPEAVEHALRLDRVVGVALDPWPGAGAIEVGRIELYRR